MGAEHAEGLEVVDFPIDDWIGGIPG